jgi:hypothetical protein
LRRRITVAAGTRAAKAAATGAARSAPRTATKTAATTRAETAAGAETASATKTAASIHGAIPSATEPLAIGNHHAEGFDLLPESMNFLGELCDLLAFRTAEAGPGSTKRTTAGTARTAWSKATIGRTTRGKRRRTTPVLRVRCAADHTDGQC